MRMIEVHAEVYAVSPSFVTRVTQKIVEAVSEEITRVIECVTEFNDHGKLQVILYIHLYKYQRPYEHLLYY